MNNKKKSNMKDIYFASAPLFNNFVTLGKLLHLQASKSLLFKDTEAFFLLKRGMLYEDVFKTPEIAW